MSEHGKPVEADSTSQKAHRRVLSNEDLWKSIIRHKYPLLLSLKLRNEDLLEYCLREHIPDAINSKFGTKELPLPVDCYLPIPDKSDIDRLQRIFELDDKEKYTWWATVVYGVNSYLISTQQDSSTQRSCVEEPIKQGLPKAMLFFLLSGTYFSKHVFEPTPDQVRQFSEGAEEEAARLRDLITELEELLCRENLLLNLGADLRGLMAQQPILQMLAKLKEEISDGLVVTKRILSESARVGFAARSGRSDHQSELSHRSFELLGKMVKKHWMTRGHLKEARSIFHRWGLGNISDDAHRQWRSRHDNGVQQDLNR